MKKYIISLIPWIILFFLFYYFNIWETNIFLRSLWRTSFFYIALTLFISPIIKLTWYQKLIPYRRSLWVLSFLLAIFHTWYYFKMEYDFQKTFFVLEHFKALDIISGLLWLAIIIILGLTSNNFSVTRLKSFWPKLQSLAYPLFLIVAIHVAFASRFDTFYIIVITLLVIIRTHAFFKDSWNNLSWKPRYLCVPCGYIYDEDLWDPDSGIKPGTKWEDIPENWKCPVCWVSKKEFILIGNESQEEKKIEAKINSITKLTSDVIELKINPESSLVVFPGQFATFIWNDESWEFRRSYSVTNYENWILTFLIKIKPTWRWWNILKELKIWDNVILWWLGWNFKLKENNNKKVFLTTWTWLAPIYSMISKLDKENIKSILFFWVRNSEDVFYEDKLKDLKNLKYEIYCSNLEKGKIWNLIKWRIDVDYFKFSPDIDFYICGNPEMTKSIIENLKSKGFENIYFEQF